MSCCPTTIRPSQEPRYPVPPSLLAQVRQWEAACPGITAIVEEAIGTGDMDALCSQGMVPPYAPQAAAQVALQCLESTWLERTRHRLVSQGPLLVRWGFVRARPELTPEQQQTLEQVRVTLNHLEAGVEPASAPSLFQATIPLAPWAAART